MGCDQFVLMQLFNQAMVAAGKGSANAPPIVGVQVNEAKPFAFLETRTPEDAANVLLFDGITIGANQLKVRRPKDFKPLPGIVDPPTGVSLIPGHLPTRYIPPSLPPSPRSCF
jgi:splicing factor U2AF subunit